MDDEVFDSVFAEGAAMNLASARDEHQGISHLKKPALPATVPLPVIKTHSMKLVELYSFQ